MLISNLKLERGPIPVEFLETLSPKQVWAMWGILNIEKVHVVTNNETNTSFYSIEIGRISEGSPAIHCGLKSQDVIVHVFSDPIASLSQVSQLFTYCNSISINVLRRDSFVNQIPTVETPPRSSEQSVDDITDLEEEEEEFVPIRVLVTSTTTQHQQQQQHCDTAYLLDSTPVPMQQQSSMTDMNPRTTSSKDIVGNNWIDLATKSNECETNNDTALLICNASQLDLKNTSSMTSNICTSKEKSSQMDNYTNAQLSLHHSTSQNGTHESKTNVWNDDSVVLEDKKNSYCNNSNEEDTNIGTSTTRSCKNTNTDKVVLPTTAEEDEAILLDTLYKNILLSSESNNAEEHTTINTTTATATFTKKSHDCLENYETDENSMELTCKETKQSVPNDNLNCHDTTFEIQDEDTFLSFHTGCDDTTTSNRNTTATSTTLDVANTTSSISSSAAVEKKKNASLYNNVHTLLPSVEDNTTVNNMDSIHKSTFRSTVGISTSSSSFSTIATAAKSKLKRLWPSSSIFQKKAMKWIPPDPVLIENGIVRFRGPVEKTRCTSEDPPMNSNNNKISETFRDASEMVQEICPHLLEEARVNINDEYYSNNNSSYNFWRNPTLSASLQTVTAVDKREVTHVANSAKTYEFGFRFSSEQKNLPSNNVGDVFVLYCEEWTKTKCCIGIIGSNDINATFLQDQKICSSRDDNGNTFSLWVCCVSKDNENTGWLAKEDMPPIYPDGNPKQQVMHLMYLGSVITTLREYEGLKGLSSIKPHLQRAIFCQQKTVPEPSAGMISISSNNTYLHDCNAMVAAATPASPSRPPSLSQDCWNQICTKLNPYQATAIETVMCGKAKENVFLLQGPPGTGKTEVVLSLISALLNAPCPQPGAWKSSGIAIQVGKSLSKSSTNESSSLNIAGGGVKTRILVCAPSNTAVDDLAWRIHKSSIGSSSVIGGFNIVRFGLLPGEERADGGRRTRTIRHKSQNVDNLSLAQRDEFLSSINLDLLAETSSERRRVLANSHVVCTTLSSSGSKCFIDASIRGDSSSEYDVVIIDEACQASEPSSLIPLKFNPNALILVGDPQQLPVTIRSRPAEQANLGRSLFQRLRDCGWPVEMLKIQYRMNYEIARFPSMQFYNGQLITPNNPTQPPPWHRFPCFPPMCIWNVRNGSMKRSAAGGICNHIEKQFITRDLLPALDRAILPHNESIQVGIISFYSDQVSLIKNTLEGMSWSNGRLRIHVSTVDGFQGSEKDIIILSCVRAGGGKRKGAGGVGFLSDYRRVNVAMTRAKHSLWVVGDCDTLAFDPVWRAFLDDAFSRSSIRDIKSFRDILNGPGPRSPSTYQNKNKWKRMKLK